MYRECRVDSRVRIEVWKTEISLGHLGQIRSLLQVEDRVRMLPGSADVFRLLALYPTLPNRCGDDLHLIALGQK